MLRGCCRSTLPHHNHIRYISFFNIPQVLKSMIALAGLTYFLRLQVVTYISGRRSFKTPESSILSILTMISKLEEVEMDKQHNSLICYTSVASCLSSATLIAFKDETVDERKILSLVLEGVIEYFIDGDISDTWSKLRKIKHVPITAKCLHRLKLC